MTDRCVQCGGESDVVDPNTVVRQVKGSWLTWCGIPCYAKWSRVRLVVEHG